MKPRYTSLADYLDRGPETQQQLADRLDISQASISEALRGRGSYRRLKQLAEACGFPLESFARPERQKATSMVGRAVVVKNGHGNRAAFARKEDRRKAPGVAPSGERRTGERRAS